MKALYPLAADDKHLAGFVGATRRQLGVKGMAVAGRSTTIYGTARSAPIAATVHFAAVWGSELVMLPALDVTPPIKQWSRTDLAVDAVNHLVYVCATSVAYTMLNWYITTVHSGWRLESPSDERTRIAFKEAVPCADSV